MNETLLQPGNDGSFVITYDENYELKSPFIPLLPGNYEALVQSGEFVAKKNDPNGKNLKVTMVVKAPKEQAGIKLTEFLPVPIGRFATPEDAQKACFSLQNFVASMHSEQLDALKKQKEFRLNIPYLIGKSVYIKTAQNRNARGGIFNSVSAYIPKKDFMDAPGPSGEESMEPSNPSVQAPSTATVAPQVQAPVTQPQMQAPVTQPVTQVQAPQVQAPMVQPQPQVTQPIQTPVPGNGAVNPTQALQNLIPTDI